MSDDRNPEPLNQNNPPTDLRIVIMDLYEYCCLVFDAMVICVFYEQAQVRLYLCLEDQIHIRMKVS